jgi:hypothetical protein
MKIRPLLLLVLALVLIAISSMFALIDPTGTSAGQVAMWIVAFAAVASVLIFLAIRLFAAATRWVKGLIARWSPFGGRWQR